MGKIIEVSRIEISLILLIEKYKKCNINEDMVNDLQLILKKINED
tara:strand:+ start:171 stop:305 length:135 start_codon:yes stop_codon:yes gene_type:complete